MVRFSAKVEGDFERFVLEQGKIIAGIRRKHIDNLARITQTVIRRIVKARVKRPGSTGRLAKGVGEIERISNGEAGIGNIDNLNREVPYWRHINFGSLAIGANWQHALPAGGFRPGLSKPDRQSFGQGRWDETFDNFVFTPSKPIPAMNYIESTFTFMKTKIPAILNRVKI